MSTVPKLDNSYLQRYSPHPLAEEYIRELANQVLPAVLVEGGTEEDDYVRRFLLVFEGKIKYSLNGWYFYNGQHWILEPKRHVAIRYMTVLRDMLRDAVRPMLSELGAKQATTSSPEEQKALQGRINAIKRIPEQLSKTSFINHVLDQVQVHSQFEASNEEFDFQPFVINGLNGTFDLKPGTLRPHSSLDMITKITYAEIIPGATCPVLDKFLGDIGAGAPGLVDFLQLSLGMALIGQQRDKCFFIIQGAKDTGKSTLMKAILWTLNYYAHTQDYSTLSSRQGTGHQESLANLAGKLVVMFDESSRSFTFNSAFVKSNSGGKIQRASRKGQHEEEFEQKYISYLFTNFSPNYDTLDDAMYDRLVNIVLPNSIPKENQDSSLREDIAKRPEFKSALLWWLIEGAMKYIAGGMKLVLPEFVVKANQECKADRDNYSDLKEQCLVFDSSQQATFRDVQAKLDEYCHEHNVPKLSSNELSQLLKANGAHVVDKEEGRVWIGVGIAGRPSVFGTLRSNQERFSGVKK